MTQAYHPGQRSLQDRFDSRRLADRLAESTSDVITERFKAFIEDRQMFFLATADDRGWPECSYKGGAKGFVRVFVPEAGKEPPVPDWKRDEWFAGTLPEGDPALDPSRPGAASIPEL